MRDPSALTFWHSCCLYLATSRRRVFLSGRRQFRIFYTLCYLAAVLGKCSLFYPFGLFFLNLVIIPSETLIFRNDQIMHGSLSSSPIHSPFSFVPPTPSLFHNWRGLLGAPGQLLPPRPNLFWVTFGPLEQWLCFFVLFCFCTDVLLSFFVSFFLFRSARDAMVCGTLEG